MTVTPNLFNRLGISGGVQTRPVGEDDDLDSIQPFSVAVLVAD